MTALVVSAAMSTVLVAWAVADAVALLAARRRRRRRGGDPDGAGDQAGASSPMASAARP